MGEGPPQTEYTPDFRLNRCGSKDRFNINARKTTYDQWTTYKSSLIAGLIDIVWCGENLSREEDVKEMHILPFLYTTGHLPSYTAHHAQSHTHLPKCEKIAPTNKVCLLTLSNLMAANDSSYSVQRAPTLCHIGSECNTDTLKPVMRQE